MLMRFIMLLVLGSVAVTGYGESIQSQTGDTMALKRVIVAGGGVTEIVYALGAEDTLVGVDTTSQFPAQTNALPKVGYLRALSAEGLLSLKPDAILATHEAGPVTVLEVVREAGVYVESLNSAYSIEGLLTRIEQVGGLLGRSTQAKALNADVRAQYMALQRALEAHAGAPKRVLFLLTHGGRSPLSSGKGTAADALIRMAGGVNVVDSFDGYRPLSQEAIATLKPDYILTTEQGLAQIGGAEALLGRAGINLTPAAQQEQLIAMNALYLLGFGPRTVQAASELSQTLYPALHIAGQ